MRVLGLFTALALSLVLVACDDEPERAEAGLAVSPTSASPGAAVTVTTGAPTRAGFFLESQSFDDGEWTPQFVLFPQADADKKWMRTDNAYVGIGGDPEPGPFVLDVPDVARPGRYRLCAPPPEAVCANLVIEG